MSKKHGNKDYYQILLDPHRSKFIQQFADEKGIKSNAYIRNIIYEHLEKVFPSIFTRRLTLKIKLLGKLQSLTG